MNEKVRVTRDSCHVTVFLIGFMGSGKTATGRVLARRLARPFMDTDRFVERTAGMPVPAIFRRRGESFFRKLEARAVRRIASGKPSVAATGGGAVLDPGNVRAMRRAGIVVWLRVPFAEACRRIERQGPARRPLADGKTAAERRRALRALFSRRRPLYRRAADLAVPVRGSPGAIAARIMARMRPRGRGQGEGA